MSWSGLEAASLLAGGMKPSTLRAVLSSTESLSELERLGPERLIALTGGRELRLGDVDLGELWAVTVNDSQYPKALRMTRTPPPVLFGKGDIEVLHRCVAVVGTRRITKIGTAIASAAVDAVAAVDAAVVSGLALGCDSAAHEAALVRGIRTAAVLGCGADVVYPRENATLLQRILEDGGVVVSEQLPGRPVSGQNLQARNRIITGSGWVFMPCEADRGSSGTIGALKTAVAEHRPIVIPRLKESWRHAKGAWMLEQLADPDGELSKSFPEFYKRGACVANAVCSERSDLQDALRILMVFSPANAA